MAYVLIKLNSDGNVSVDRVRVVVVAGFDPKAAAVSAADDLIRAELNAVAYAGDVEYVDPDHPLEPDHREGLIGVWVTDQESYELWAAGERF